jgi:D-alanyl-D-alanine carboxypeptidase
MFDKFFSMRQTINIIIAFFIILPALLLSYQIGTPSIAKTKAGIGEYLSEPALNMRVPKALKTIPRETLPVKKQDAKKLDMQNKSVLAFDFKQDFYLYEKNTHEQRPIASLTKLITAAVVLDYSKLDETVSISKEAIKTEGNSGLLREGEILTVYDLLAAALLESSNDAAYALAEYTGNKLISNQETNATPIRAFVRTMNQKFNDLGLVNSNFTDPSGLEDSKSFSTAYDFANFIKYLRNNPNYDVIWQILKLKTYTTQSKNNIASHEFKSTNSLLDELDGVIGGKTGYTNNALGNLMLVLTGPNNTEIIYLVMGSNDRFGEMKKLIDWVNESWEWPKN